MLVEAPVGEQVEPRGRELQVLQNLAVIAGLYHTGGLMFARTPPTEALLT